MRIDNVNNEGVSPVVGVMLMLVVTIIIAAVVSAFAGGLAEEQAVSPVANIDVRFTVDTFGEVMLFEHQGGDNLPLKDLRIESWYTVPSTGEVITHVVDGSLDPDNEDNNFENAGSPSNDGYPWYNNDVQGPFGGTSHKASQFGGTHIWSTGDVLKASFGSVDTVIGFDPYDEKYGMVAYDPTAPWIDAKFVGGDVLIKIKHIPSGKYIYSKNVHCRGH